MSESSTSAAPDGTVNWSASALGAIEHWPRTLRLAVDIVLGTPLPMLLTWGEHGAVVFNRAYAELAGPLHPEAPGGMLPAVAPPPLTANPQAFERALRGQAQHLERQTLCFPFPQGREECACDLHLTPLPDDQGVVRGVLCALLRCPVALSAPTQASLRVLVVEDNLDSQYLVCEMLKAFGHHAEGVGHAEGALAMLAGASYDVLFADVSLPGMSGVDLARQALRGQAALQVIFASGYGDVLLRHIEFPFQSLQKPYELEQLQAALARAALDAGERS